MTVSSRNTVRMTVHDLNCLHYSSKVTLTLRQRLSRDTHDSFLLKLACIVLYAILGTSVHSKKTALQYALLLHFPTI